MNTFLLICLLILSQNSEAFEVIHYPATDEDTLLLEAVYKHKDDPLKEILRNGADENTDILKSVKILLHEIQNTKVDTELGQILLTNKDEDFPELETTRQVFAYPKVKDALTQKRSLFESVLNIDQYIDNTNLFLDKVKELSRRNHCYQEGFISSFIKQATYLLKQQIAGIKRDLLEFDESDIIRKSVKLQRSTLSYAKMVDLLSQVQKKQFLEYINSKGAKGQKPVTSLNVKLSFPTSKVRGLANIAWSYYDDAMI